MPRQRGRAQDHEAELQELQRRFNALADQQRSTEQSSSLMLASRSSVPELHMSASDGSLLGARAPSKPAEGTSEAELKRLDDEIVMLRRKHDRLHETNQKRRAELDGQADKLKDLHHTRFNPSETPSARLEEMEERLGECAGRYDEEFRQKMSYEQVIKRLKREQLEWPNDVKQLEALLHQKENDYEQLLVMSHDANSSKEGAKVELLKFESHVFEERKLREKELQERRAHLQKKQQLASELDRNELERQAALQAAQRESGEDAAKAEAAKMEVLIRDEGAKIGAYEAAFQQIKEATGVSDVNEVIQRFLLQEETHQSLMAMTRESQLKIDTMRNEVESERAQVLAAEYSLASQEPAEDADGPEGKPDTLSVHDARKLLSKSRDRWRKVLKTSTNTKAAVQHIVDLLEPLRAPDEVVGVMSDETLLQHIQFAERKLAIISSAFFEMEDAHKQVLAGISAPAAPPPKAPALKKELTLSVFGAVGKEVDPDSEDEFEEDMEEDVMDRTSLKKQSLSLVDKGAKKRKPRRRRADKD